MEQEPCPPWLRINVATVVLVGAQVLVLVVWLVTLGNRVATIEARGSPQMEAVLLRLTDVTTRLEALQRQLDRHEQSMRKSDGP